MPASGVRGKGAERTPRHSLVSEKEADWRRGVCDPSSGAGRPGLLCRRCADPILPNVGLRKATARADSAYARYRWDEMDHWQQFDDAIAGVQGAFHVSHIATSPLRSAATQERVRAVRAWAKAMGVDNVPVVARGAVVGVLENVSGDMPDVPRPADDESAGQAMTRLSADMLIESTTRLDRVLAVLLETPYYRLVLREGRVDAIVTPSDLNKLPVRVLAFTMLAHLEAVALVAIGQLTDDDREAVGLLGRHEAAQVSDLWGRLRSKRLDVSVVDMTSLPQKGRILAALGVFPDSAKDVVRDFDGIYKRLRNPVMHGGSYVSDSIDELRCFADDLQIVRRRTDEIHESVGAA
jgi:predicted transcriptional regulator